MLSILQDLSEVLLALDTHVSVDHRTERRWGDPLTIIYHLDEISVLGGRGGCRLKISGALSIHPSCPAAGIESYDTTLEYEV